MLTERVQMVIRRATDSAEANKVKEEEFNSVFPILILFILVTILIVLIRHHTSVFFRF